MNSMIIEQLKKANVIDSTGKVTLANLATYTLTHDILVVMYDGTVNNITGTYLRAVIEKWTFQDKAMGEQFITFDFLSEQPVAWAVNDYCIFRGERFVLNYIPSVTQKGRRNAVLDSYKYEGVKLNSLADELTRCQMLDVVLTSGQHDPDAGTNHTGSSQFQLFCGETTVNGVTRTAVMTLGDRILANLNRMYGENVWSIVYGDNTHTEDQQLSFDNQYVSEALAEVKNKFDLNYAVKGRTIYIGCELGDVAGVEYGFGPGYPTDEAGGKGLFELKKISDSSQQIVTRLRVLGSTKNLPYRYYNNAYPLPQALFPLNLQLPDTFLPEGSPSDPAGANTKWGHNKQRSSQLRAVKGATNDAYIDKGDDAAATTEGIREATIRFDGSDSKLEEIYPTIENVTYDELRGSNVPDQDGNTGPEAYPNYESDEKVNEILAIGYKYDGQMFDDANIGSGILSENNGGQAGSIRDISISQRLDSIRTRVSDYFCGTEQILFTIAGQTAGKYFFTPVMSKEPYFFYSPASVKDRIGFIIRVKATSGGITTTIAEYKSDFYSGRNSVALPSIPDVFYMMDAQVREIALSGTADITVTFIPCAKASTDILYGVGPKPNSSYTAQYVWNSVDNMDSSGMPFHFFVKDMGFDFAAQFNGETPTIVMKSGDCVGREFQIGQSIEKVEYQGKKGYMLTLNRASDSSLNTYYPNARNQISADDQFVITGIDMPDAYIKAAEMRLLSAATEWLAENGNTNFHYQPTIDDIYLKRNYENMVKAGTPQDSVFWKIYAGYDLTFHPIPDNPSDPEPEAISVTIESVTITMGEGLTRKVDILLNDELKESTLKRVSREVKDLSDKIQRTGSGMSTATMETAIRTIGDKQYLSKVENDTAAGDITFNGNIRFNKDALFAQGAYFGENLDGSFNTEIDALGNIHTARNVEAMWGVAAYGMASLAMNGGGGQGTVTAINFEGAPERIYTPSDGLITLPDYPTAASLISDGLASQNYVASYFASNFTQLNIKNTLGISDWALAPAKPSYNFSEIGSKPTTLAGYGITDAHIANGVVTLGGNTITPATLTNGKIPLSQIPDAILGQLIYGGTVNGSGVVTLSQNAKDKWGITSLTLTSTNYSTYEGAFFIASADATSGVPSTLGLLVGDWVVATASGWGKIDNTDAVTGVKGSAESNYRIGNVNITPANIGLGNVENTALSTWTGTIKIVTLGTITTGVWHGSAIADDYIASASAWNAKYDKDPNGIPKTDLASAVQTSLGKADTALQSESDPVFTASAAYGITSSNINEWNAKQNALAFDGTYDASTNKVATKSTVTNAINALDVSNISGFGAGKTLASLTETDGKIAATFQNISITKSQVSDFPTTWALANITGADDLKAIEALTGTSGFLKKTAANTWALDTDVASGTALSGVSTRVGTLEGYFSSGVANNAAKLGGQLPSYYAAAADYTKTSDFQSFSIKVGTTTLGTYSPTSALILSLVAGSNIAFDTDATNHKLTIRNTYSYTLPMASSDSRGGIRVGNTLNIDSNGILNANIYDGLDQGYTTYALSAKQGKALKTALDTLKTGLTSKGAHNLPIYLNSNAQAVAIDALSVSGNVESTAGGVAASGIASLALNGGGGQGTLTQIQVNGVALADTSGVVNITATTGNAAGKIAIAGQQIPVYGLGSLAYLSSLAFTDLSSHPTTLGGYGITDAKIANGVITLGGNTITPITSLPTFYNLAFQNASGTTVDTYKPTTSPSKTIKAGSNVTISAASNVITIAATNTWTPWAGATSSAAGTAGYMPAPTSAQRNQFLRGDGTWVSLNNYSLPLAANGTRGGVQIGYTTDGANRNYAVQLSSEKMYVNVPWTDTDTKVTSAANHYTPTSESYTPTAGSWSWNSTEVVVGITKDSKGHIVGVTTTKIANPNTDTKVTQTVTTSSNTSWRPLLIGQSYSDASTFAPTTTTDTVYATRLAKFAPKDGLLAIRGLNKMNTDGTLVNGSEYKVFNTNGGVSNLAAWAQADSKPSYTYSEVGAAASSHTHGNIQNGGALQTNDVSIANGDKLVITDASDSAKIARSGITFDASTTNKALTPKGTWESFLQGNQTITLSGDVSGSGATSIAVTIGASKVTNAMLAGSIANSKLASAGKFTIGSTAIELGTTYTAANFRSYLGLGGAATYGATSSVTDGGTSLVTSGGVYSYVNALLTAAMKIEGETTTAISDGSTTNPVVIGGQSVSAYKGMVVFYGSKEFVWVGTNWKELGDESSFALKTTTVSGTGYLTGGGALSSNQTIDIASSVKTKIDNGATAYGWGNHANAGYALASNLGTASTHAHGDYVTAITYDSTNRKLQQSKGGGTATDIVTFGTNAFNSTSYLPLAGGTLTGVLTTKGSQYDDSYSGALNMNNSNIYGLNAIYTCDAAEGAAEGLNFYRDNTHVDTFWVAGGNMYFVPNRALGTNTSAANSNVVLHSGNSSVSLSGSTLTVKINDTSKSLTNTDRYVNSAAFAHDSTNDNVKMTLTRAGSDTATVTANIPKVSSSSAGVAPKGAAVSSQSQTTKFLREDGTWAAPSYTTNTDTKNTTGGDDTSSKIFLVGMTAQTTSNGNSRTYTQDTAYVGTDGHLYSNSKQVVNLTDTQAITNKTYNGLTLTAQTTGFYIGGGNTTAKTLVVNDNYTLQSACGHAHEDYVTTIGTSGNTLTWSKGGTAQTAITIPYATAAGKLNTNAGSATNPVYFANGVPVACTYSLNKTVPADAVFTDTNTHRPIQLNGTEILGNNTTALNLKAGTNVSLSNSNGTVTIAATDTTYSANNGVGLSGTTFYNSGVRAATINGNYLRINTNGTNADLTIPYATNANYATTAGSAPASDVYDWAKASTKPSYSFSEISSRGEALLGWGGTNISGGVTPIGMSLSNEHSANRFAYINGACLTFEYSSNGGSSWTDYGYSNTTKSKVFTLSESIPIGRTSGNYSTNSRTRITITAQNGSMGYVYTNPKKMLINISSSGGMKVLVEYRTGTNYLNGGAWSTFGEYSLSGWSGWNDIPLILGTLGGGTTQKSNNWQLRLTFIMTSFSSDYPTTAYLNAIRIYGENAWQTPSTMATTNHLYSFDMSQNAAFPAGVSATSFTENGTALSSKYLGISAKAADSDKLDGNDSSYFAVKKASTGSATNPIYTDANGAFQACTYSLNKTVPSDALFTDANVKQEAVSSSSYTNWRTIPFGASNSATETFDATTVTGQLYSVNTLKFQPSSGTLRTMVFKSTASQGTAPLVVASTTAVSNLNADLLDGQHGSYYQPKVSALGSTTEPVYISAAGTFSKASKYAGGTAVTLNGSSKAASTASFYAPTGAGTSGQILKSTAGTPEWINQSALVAGKATILETTRTIWGQNFNGSANVTGDMSNVGNIAFSASGKNIGGTMYFDTTNHRIGINDSTPSCAFDVTGDVQASGGIAAGGILNLAYNGAGTQGTLTQIQINGRALTDTSGIVNIPLANTTSTGDGAMSHSDKLKLDGIATGATNVNTDTVAGWGYTKNVGTVTGVKMNGSVKGSSGVVDLGTVITDVSGKADKRMNVLVDNNGSATITMTNSTTARYHFVRYPSSSSVTAITLQQATSALTAANCGTAHYELFKNEKSTAITLTLTKYSNSSYYLIAPSKTITIPANSSVELSYIHIAGASSTFYTVVTIGDVMINVS